MISLKGDRNDNVEDSDINVVERYLAEYPDETEKCIPMALRQILETRDLPQVPFFSAARLRDYLQLLWKYDDTGDIDVIDYKLIDAAEHGLTYLVPYLLDRKADVNAGSGTPLTLAAENGDNDIVNLLLDSKADIHAEGDIALQMAAQYGQTKTVKLLLDRNADIHEADDLALKLANNNGQQDTVKFLLDMKADITALSR